MGNCYINVSPELVKSIAERILGNYPDSVISLVKAHPMATYSPTKRKNYFRITFEVALPVDAITGASALTDFGGFLVLRLPKDRIKPQFLEGK